MGEPSVSVASLKLSERVVCAIDSGLGAIWIDELLEKAPAAMMRLSNIGNLGTAEILEAIALHLRGQIPRSGSLEVHRRAQSIKHPLHPGADRWNASDDPNATHCIGPVCFTSRNMARLERIAKELGVTPTDYVEGATRDSLDVDECQ